MMSNIKSKTIRHPEKQDQKLEIHRKIPIIEVNTEMTQKSDRNFKITMVNMAKERGKNGHNRGNDGYNR